MRAVSFNVVAGVTHGLRGFELGGVANVETSYACGVQIAGAANVVSGPVHGVQVAGGLNLARGQLLGAQFGAVNLVLGDLDGAQLGGGFSLAGGVRGVQIAAVNVATGSVRGGQLGAINVAQGDVRGAQLGVINFAAGAVSGVQLGVVNVASDVDAPIGLVNVVEHGVTHVDLWGTESGLGMLSLVHGGRLIHNIYGVGGRTGANGTRFGVTYGIGARLHRSEWLTVDLDLLGTWLVNGPSVNGPSFLTQLRLLGALRLTSGVSLLLGPTYQVMTAYQAQPNYAQAPFGATSFSVSSAGHTGWADTGWPGVVIGLRGL